MSIQILTIEWNTITIELSYDDDYSKPYRQIYGHPVAHLEIRSMNKVKLPITHTGYLSHFMPTSMIEEFGGAEKFVIQWLNQESKSKEWKQYVEGSKQLSLFWELL